MSSEADTGTRTVRASITNHSQVTASLDRHGRSASKLWNVGLWTIHRVWVETGDHIPGESELKAYLKRHERYTDLQNHSSQKVLEELSEAFGSWYAQDDPEHNPPGYRKHGDEHPRSTITWKTSGFWLDTKHDQVRLSKGKTHKQCDNTSNFILCEFETRPEIDLSEVESVQQVRAVWTGKEWELHIVYRMRLDDPVQSGEHSAGIDLGIDRVAAVSFGDEATLYPGGALKEDNHYFRQVEYETEGENGPSNRCAWARQQRSRRQTHFLHALTADIVEECVRRNVGTIAVGHPKHIRNDSDWGRHANKRLHDWPFNRIIDYIEYKAAERGIDVERVDEGSLRTSKTCCCCGMAADSNRVERGLYQCEECGLTANADVNAAENMRLTVPPSSSPGDRGWDRCNGCLAQPAVRLFEKRSGRVVPREQVCCEP